MKLKLETKEGVIVQDATEYKAIHCEICRCVVYISSSDNEDDVEDCAYALKRHYDFHTAGQDITPQLHRRIDHVTVALAMIGVLAVVHAFCAWLGGLPR